MPVEAHPMTETDDGGAEEGEQLVVVAARASFSRESVGVAAAVPQWRARARALVGLGRVFARFRGERQGQYEVCLAVLENSDDPELVAAAKARLLKYLE